MRVKKYLALTLAAMLATTMLTACPWDIEDDAASDSSSTPSSSSRPSYDDDEDNDSGNEEDSSSAVTVNPDDPTTWQTVSTGGNKIIKAPQSVNQLTKDLVNDMFAVDDVNGIDLSESSVTTIPYDVFRENKQLVTLTVKDGTAVEAHATEASKGGAFSGCSNLEVVEGSLSSVGVYAFNECKNLKEVTVNGPVAESAFVLCESLRVVKGTITSIGQQAFTGCYALEAVSLSSASIAQLAFQGCRSLSHIRVTKALKNTEKNALEGFAIDNLTVHYDGEKDDDFEASLSTILIGLEFEEENFTFQSGCTDDIWNSILADASKEDETTINSKPVPDNAAARFILGL